MQLHQGLQRSLHPLRRGQAHRRCRRPPWEIRQTITTSLSGGHQAELQWVQWLPFRQVLRIQTMCAQASQLLTTASLRAPANCQCNLKASVGTKKPATPTPNRHAQANQARAIPNLQRSAQAQAEGQGPLIAPGETTSKGSSVYNRIQ